MKKLLTALALAATFAVPAWAATQTVTLSVTRVNKDGFIDSVATNVPSLDYPLIDGVVQDCPHLLLDPQRTNIVTYS